jgi:hypothetical protein
MIFVLRSLKNPIPPALKRRAINYARLRRALLPDFPNPEEPRIEDKYPALVIVVGFIPRRADFFSDLMFENALFYTLVLYTVSQGRRPSRAQGLTPIPPIISAERRSRECRSTRRFGRRFQPRVGRKVFHRLRNAARAQIDQIAVDQDAKRCQCDHDPINDPGGGSFINMPLCQSNAACAEREQG